MWLTVIRLSVASRPCLVASWLGERWLFVGVVARLPGGEVTGYPLKHRTSFIAITSCNYLVYHERLKVLIFIFFVFIFVIEYSCFSFNS